MLNKNVEKRSIPLYFFFIVVPLAHVYADEGYIPYLSDFLEPDEIGFRGSEVIIGVSCWISHSDCSSHKPGMTFSRQTSVNCI